MEYLILIFALAATVATSGCYVAAIPRFNVIKHTVTTNELTGRWVLSAESRRSLAADGFAKKPGQEFTIVLRPDGSCSCHTVLQGRYADKEGQWSIRYDPADHYRNRLDFRFQDEYYALTSVASDSSGMVLWQSWGDPDAGIDLVYRKLEGGEPDGAANRGQPIRPDINRTSSAAGSGR